MLAWLVALLLVASSALAQTPGAIQKPTTRTGELLFVFEPYPPYIRYEDGRLTGSNVEILREACRRLGLAPVFKKVPWKRAMDEVKTGYAQAVFSLFMTAERETFLAFPEVPLAHETNILVTRSGADLAVSSLEDLEGLKIGVVEDYAYGDPFDALPLTRETSHDNEMLLRKLEYGRTDLAVINERVFRYLVRKLAMEGLFRQLDYVVSSEPLYVAFSKTSGNAGDPLAARFSEVLAQLEDEGVLEAMALSD